ncbi:hypothetical protein BgiBS90_000830, partial [Biomphalaria glabrata]
SEIHYLRRLSVISGGDWPIQSALCCTTDILPQEAEYIRLIGKQLEPRPTLAPPSLMFDFEKASQNVVSTLPPADQACRCVYILDKDSGIKYKMNILQLHIILNEYLPFHLVPAADVNTAFQELNDKVSL